MKHRFRFFGEPLNDDTWALEPEEVHHFLKVLKLKDGEPLEVTDGQGAAAFGVAQVVSKSKVNVVVEKSYVTPMPERKLALAIGAIKPADFEAFLPSLIELSVNEIWVFHQAGVAKQRMNDKFQSRCLQIARAALKQCKLDHLPEIHYLKSIDEVLNRSENYKYRFALDHSGENLRQYPVAENPDSIVGVIGGERGLNEDELLLLEGGGFQKVKLARSVLRARTALISFASVLEFQLHP